MPTNNVTKKRGKSKIKISKKREAAMQKIVDSYSKDFDVKMSVIAELIPLGLKAVAEELTNEVLQLAAEKHSLAIEQQINRLIERGLKFERGILFIIDGSKGIKKAIEHKFSGSSGFRVGK